MNNDVLSNLIITKVCSANRINSAANIITRRRSRERWAIAVKNTGYTEYICKGEKILSGPGHIVILSEGADYTWKSFGGECLIIDFDASSAPGEIFSFKVKDNTNLTNLFYKIEHEKLVSGPLCDLKNIKTLYEMIIILLESQKEKYSLSSKENIVGPIIEYIAKNYNNPNLTNEMLSRISGTSTVYFRKIFTEVYKCAPMEYVHKLRMNKAVEMLGSDYNSISAIAESVGYNSIYHFSKMFKRYYGVSPSNYKRQKQ
ncbi:MAG: helix-turn-helix transcriptional regulator [Clostridia bacterium]|nr:helix-turn-helix transcriptional regulator [Clostridia bacterium]